MSTTSKTGHCIICHRDHVEMSDEHVIPDAIGGYYHIYKVCKECNSKLGDNVDSQLLKHWVIKCERHIKKLAGKTNKIPNPLLGAGVLEDGTKVRVEEDSAGVIVPRILPSSPRIAADGKSFSFSVDVKDKKLINHIADKTKKKLGIDGGYYHIVENQQVKQIPNPIVRLQAQIDLKNYRIGLLKMAYEFAVDKIPSYYDDPKARLYAEILKDGALDRLSEVGFVGDGFINAEIKPFEDYIDYCKPDRHILILFNANGKLYCFVKLFENTICQLIMMSEKAYDIQGSIVIAINDYSRRECQFYDVEKLSQSYYKSSCYEVKLSEEDDAFVQSEMQSSGSEIGFACNRYHDNIIFDANGKPYATQSMLCSNIDALGLSTCESKGNTIITRILVPVTAFLLLSPSDRLVHPLEFIIMDEVEKI